MDIKKLAEKLNQLNERSSSGGSGGGMNFLSIKDGRNVIRILPPAPGKEDFYQEVWVHYGVGKTESNKRGSMVVCPTTHGEDKPCPVCELSKQYFELSTKKDDKYSKQAKSLFRKKRVYYNAISRDEDLAAYVMEKDEDGNMKWTNTKSESEFPESPIKVLGTGVGIFKDILGLIIDPEYGDVTHPEEGLDLIITKTGSGQYNTEYDVKTVRKESPTIPEDAPQDLLDNWQDMYNDLEPLAKAKSYDALLSLLNGEEEPTEEEQEEKEEPEESTGSSITDSEDDDDDMEEEIRKALARRRKNK